MSIVLTISELAPSLNGSGGLIRMHWSAYGRIKDRWTVLVREAAGLQRMKGPCTMLMERYYAQTPLDFDNLYASVKIPGDALRAAKIIQEDNPEIVTSLVCHQFKVATKKEQRTVITLTPV